MPDSPAAAPLASLAAILPLLSMAGCWRSVVTDAAENGGPDTYTGSDTDTDSDADTDSDSDADTEPTPARASP